MGHKHSNEGESLSKPLENNCLREHRGRDIVVMEDQARDIYGGAEEAKDIR